MVKSLVGDNYEVLQFTLEAELRNQKKWFNPHLILGLLFFLEIFILFSTKLQKVVRNYDKTFFFVLGLASLLMMLLWFAFAMFRCAVL